MAGDLPFRWPTDAVFIFLAIGMAILIAMSRELTIPVPAHWPYW